MVQYVEVSTDEVRAEVRAEAEAGLEFAKRHLQLPDVGIRWFDFAPPTARTAWFQRPDAIFGTIDQKQPDHIRIWAGQGAPMAGPTAAHESFHISTVLQRTAAGLPLLPEDNPEDEDKAKAFAQSFLDR